VRWADVGGLGDVKQRWLAVAGVGACFPQCTHMHACSERGLVQRGAVGSCS